MPKIKCPHCGANNQDVTEKDRCWQCDAVLGDPAPAVVAEPPAPLAAPVQKQVEPVKPAPLPVDSSPQSRFPVAPVAIVVAVLLILLAIIFFVMKK
ncbi:MAG: hypothetical protein JWL77_2120 [Chthonomonadaceae bacterium]|nr:hypothetical protein [Chthonomonadaceae bacterium]